MMENEDFSIFTLQKREAVPHLRTGLLSEVMWPFVSTPFPKGSIAYVCGNEGHAGCHGIR